MKFDERAEPRPKLRTSGQLQQPKVKVMCVEWPEIPMCKVVESPVKIAGSSNVMYSPFFAGHVSKTEATTAGGKPVQLKRVEVRFALLEVRAGEKPSALE